MEKRDASLTNEEKKDEMATKRMTTKKDCETGRLEIDGEDRV